MSTHGSASTVVEEDPKDLTGPWNTSSAVTLRDDADGDAAEKGDGVVVEVRPPDVYDRFTPRKKRSIIAVVSYSALISPFTASVILPSIPQIAEDLHTTQTVINITIAIFILTIGIAPVVWSPLSGFYGRRPIYLASMPIMIASSIGVALCNSVGALIATRVLQGIGSSSVLAVGAGTIGDIYRPTDRANAMGWYYSGALFGPALAPVIGGIFTQYVSISWRAVQYLLAGCGSVAFLLTFFFLPETSHRPLPHDQLKEERNKRFVVYIFNPLTSLGLLRWPNLLCVAFTSSCVLLQTYVMLVPLTDLLKTQYGIKNVAVSGCVYLGQGVGCFIGARIAGPMADREVKKWIQKRGYRRAEDRLWIVLFPTGVLLPLSALGYGWLIEYAAGGVGPVIVMLLINGAALMLALTPLNTYAVDSMQTRSAETIAINNCMRYIFAAGASAVVVPIADAIKWGPTLTIAAGIAWTACAIVMAMLRYGSTWREKANAKYGYPAREDERPNPFWPETESESGDAGGPVVVVEDKEGDARVSASADDEHHDEKHEEPGQLVKAAELLPKRGPTTGRAGRGGPSHRAQGDLPPVEEVLSRTVSLSSASVHGGG